MYAVIMAGGGGTRLHPLSRPERPEAFLPLLPSGETLLQATARRLPTEDITVVTDRRYERFVRDQLPDAHLLLEPMGRNTAAAIALATVAIDRPDDEVMLVVPADAYIDPGRRASTRGSSGDAEDRSRATPSTSTSRSSPSASRSPARRREYGYLIPKLETEARRRRAVRLPARSASRRSRRPERAEMLLKEPGVAWNAGIFLWRRRAIRAALGRFTGLLQTLRPMMGAVDAPRVTPTKRSSSRCRSTTRSWRAPPATAAS